MRDDRTANEALKVIDRAKQTASAAYESVERAQALVAESRLLCAASRRRVALSKLALHKSKAIMADMAAMEALVLPMLTPHRPAPSWPARSHGDGPADA